MVIALTISHERMISRLRQAVLPLPIPITEDLVQRVVSVTVDALFHAILNSEVGSTALSPKQRLVRIRRLEAETKAELAMNERRAARQKFAAARRLKVLLEQKAAIKREIKTRG